MPIKDWFNATDFELATSLVQIIKNNLSNSENNISCIQAFLKLHQLAKPEYKKFFIEQWQQNAQKFIIQGYFELKSPLKLTHINPNIDCLSQEICDLLANDTQNADEEHKIKINNILITLIMLIEKRIIDGENLKQQKFYISDKALPSNLPDEYEDNADYYISNDDDIVTGSSLTIKKNEIKLSLVNHEIGELTGEYPNYIFTSAKNFTGNEITMRCELNSEFYQCITLKVDKLMLQQKDKDFFNDLFSRGHLLFVLLNKDHKLAFEYLLNSDYFSIDIHSNIYKLQQIKRTLLLSQNEVRSGKYLLSQAANKKDPIYRNLLLEKAQKEQINVMNKLANFKLRVFSIPCHN